MTEYNSDIRYNKQNQFIRSPDFRVAQKDKNQQNKKNPLNNNQEKHGRADMGCSKGK